MACIAEGLIVITALSTLRMGKQHENTVSKKYI